MISLRRYFVLSALAAGAVIYHAFATRRQFFPATVALSTSKLAVATVGNLSFAMALCMYNLVIKIFLGTLREIELERVKEKLSSAIMETCLALTIFREEFNMSFVGMFTVLTFVKVFHWLVQDRVDYIEVTPSVSRLAHTRIVTFLLVLLSLDVVFLHQTIAAALAHKGHSVQLLFAFEYIILASAAAATFLKYILSMVDAAMEGRWDGKGTYVFYLELMTDMLHLFVYCIFFVIVFTNYGLPLHLIRDLYMTFRNFRNRITDFLRFRQVTARMDRFPDASVDDLARCDGICIICREEMVTAGLNKKLHCGHVFHLHCLRSWLERQQNCPTCRTSVFRPPPPADPVVAAAAGNPAEPAAGALQPPPAANAAAHQAAIAPPGAAAAEPAAALDRPPPAAAAAPGGHGHTGGSGIRQRLSHHRARSPRTRGHSSASGSAAAAATPDAAAAAVAGAQGIPGFWPNAGTMVWQMPQWYPVTSMATFSNTPLQYAGQQSAVEQAQAQAIAAASMVPMVPAIFPAMSAPFTTMMPPVSAGATPEAAAAAAAMAAAAAALYMPPVVPGLAMMPPAMLPGAAAGSAGEQMAAAAAANAAAAAAAAAVMGGAAPPEVMQASFEATQQMLQRQLDYLQTQMSKIRSNELGSSAQRSGQQQAAGQSGVTGTAAAGSSSAGSSSAAAGSSASASAGTSSSVAVPEKPVTQEACAAAVAEQQVIPAQSTSSSSSNNEGTAAVSAAPANKISSTPAEAPPAAGRTEAAVASDDGESAADDELRH